MGKPEMGEGNSSANKTRYNILYGTFRRRVEEGTEGAITRKLAKGKNAGKDVWELAFSNYAGYIKRVQLHENDFGTDIAVDFASDEKSSSDTTIYIPLYSAQGRSFFNLILNSSPSDPYKLTLWQKNADSKVILFMAQWRDAWEDIERRFNDWDDNKKQLVGLSPPVEGVSNGKPSWDYTDHTKELTDLFQKEVMPLIQKDSFLYDPKTNDDSAAVKPETKKPMPAMGGGAEAAAEEEDDDLPF
jgi:hypothetical protein